MPRFRTSLTNQQEDILVLLAGCGASTAEMLAQVSGRPSKSVGAALSGLRIRRKADITGTTRVRRGETFITLRLWEIDFNSFADAEWRDLMLRWCSRHGVDPREVLTEGERAA